MLQCDIIWKFETNLEESEEDVRIGISQENESQKCTETTVEDGWSDGRNCRRGPLILGSCLDHERVGNVGCVIDTQANGQHQIDARNCVDR